MKAEQSAGSGGLLRVFFLKKAICASRLFTVTQRRIRFKKEYVSIVATSVPTVISSSVQRNLEFR